MSFLKDWMSAFFRYNKPKEVFPVKTRTKAGIVTFLIATLAVSGGGLYLYHQHQNDVKNNVLQNDSVTKGNTGTKNSSLNSSSSYSMQNNSQSFQAQQRMNEDMFRQQVQQEQERFKQEQENFQRQQAEMQRQFNQQIAQDRQAFSQNMREHQESNIQAQEDAMKSIWGVQGGMNSPSEQLNDFPPIQEPPAI